MKKGIKNIITGGVLKKISVAGIALIMIIAQIPDMGLASQTVTITYKSNCGGCQADIIDTISKGSSYSVRNNPFTLSGYTFIGWNLKADGTGTSFTPCQTVVVNANQTVYAQWKAAAADKITITYKANAGDNQADIIDTINKGSSYTVRTNTFIRSGYIFTGWNLKADGTGTSVAPCQTLVVNANYTLYAQWKAVAAETVTITYKANAGDNQADINDTVIKGSSYTLRTNPFIRSGFTFDGWNTKADGSGTAHSPGKVVVANASNTLYAQWKSTAPENVAITYKANASGSQPDIVDVVIKGSSYTIRQFTFTSPGYIYLGYWNTKADGSGVNYYPGQVIIANANLTLYMQWNTAVPETVAITYRGNAFYSQPDIVDIVNKGSLYTIRQSSFTSPGYIYTGYWNTNPDGTGVSYYPGQVITASYNLTLYAQWKVIAADTVTITYKANANDSQADYKDIVNKDSYSTIWQIVFSRSGYTFTGYWNTKADGTGTAYYAGQNIIAYSDLTLYAQWKSTAAETVTITYKANAGDSQADMKETAIKGKSYTIKQGSYVRYGYTFTGFWNTSADGKGTIYHPGQIITANSDLTLYMQWKQDAKTIVDKPTGCDGRILRALKAGDICDWIEIARNGCYSLIVRKISICNVKFGSSTAYSSSNVRKNINDFFNSSALCLGDKLPLNANLRKYTVKCNALSVLGTSGTTASLTNGFCKPTTTYATKGDDVCFALSYCEAANFVSTGMYINGSLLLTHPILAISNFLKLNQANKNIWLRTPGSSAGTAAQIGYGGLKNYGSVFQDLIGNYALVHPAVWVDSAIFD